MDLVHPCVAGSGVGTGLAGLSAATVMVPILIVLCPSFAGETGAYQATAIALASDILGSAVTTYTYARHKNIDLKRGWIMLACILTMCTVGSYAAYLAGNVVLGTFTLFLTFCIGIRFLIRPDTSRRKTAAKGQSLDWKGVVISLFFGLTIGFGTGFVGTGGGMMMLVVFTAFLGMELKTAVGTSTFIMTFTALIASVSHILIHPAILPEKWDVMLLCIAVAAAASLISARFANRVSNRTVGLCTGAVLTALGGAMLLLNFWPQLSAVPLVMQTLRCLDILILYLVPCVLILPPVRFLTKVPSFMFRKLLHIVAFSCFTVMLLAAENWQAAAVTSVIIAAASILMWGVGDAAAALIGIPFGRHKVTFPPVHGKKSWEGTGAMLAASFLAGFFLLHFYSGYPSAMLLPGVLAGAVTGAGTELLSPSEWDTVTVPIAILIVLLLLV